MAELKADLSLGEVATQYLSSLPPGQSETIQQEVLRFVRWYGWERSMAELTPAEIANFAARVASSTTDPVNKLEIVRAFLLYGKSQRLTSINLAAHLKFKKSGGKGLSTRGFARGSASPPPSLTVEGYEELKSKIERLRQERLGVVEEVRRAREDKDFRENAPLDAARERLGHLEFRIREIESTLGRAVVGEKQEGAHRAGLGSSVTLLDPSSGTNFNYVLVDPSEANLAKGKISTISPLGKALIGRRMGEEIEVLAPGGSRRFRLEAISP